MEIEEIKQEAKKTWNYHNSHNIMTDQPKGVMAVSEAKKLFDKLLEVIENKKGTGIMKITFGVDDFD